MLTEKKRAGFVAHNAGYEDRMAGKPNDAGSRTGTIKNMYHSGWLQAANDLIIHKRRTTAAQRYGADF